MSLKYDISVIDKKTGKKVVYHNVNNLQRFDVFCKDRNFKIIGKVLRKRFKRK
jgi:DNA modification methylase